jgi:3-deoxy-manno-octulosonate cytidylyltransferase (CMP-KDO synthetase)
MNVIAIIPARMGSSRFPGKPLEKILGKPMVGHVYERVSQTKILSETIVATCDREIYDYVMSIGGVAVMTSAMHERASDRCAEALELIERERDSKFDIVVMVQGDEPMTNSEMLEEAIAPMLIDNSIDVVNLVAEISSEQEFNDPNCIKVVYDLNGDSLFFSRQPIPTQRFSSERQMRKQVCVIPFKRDFLIEYTRLKPTPLEIKESIDMLRVLEHGKKVRMVPTLHQSFSVDTEADLERVEQLMSCSEFS